MLYEKFQETTQYIQKFFSKEKPEYAIILGSGLATLIDAVTPICEIPYLDIPNFPHLNI